jgi:hypothetical protein
MCEIAGVDSMEGRNVSDLFVGDDLAVVREHLERRFTHRAADEYRVAVTRPAPSVPVPILCSAMPEINEHGEGVGVIAIVRDLLMEDVSEKVHQAIEELRDGRTILEAVQENASGLLRSTYLASRCTARTESTIVCSISTRKASSGLASAGTR